MRIRKRDYDFYYLIICSRGPGSETITVNKVDPDDVHIPRKEEDSLIEEDLKETGVFSLDLFDEGPVLAVPTGTMPLDKIYKWLVKDTIRWNEDAGTPLCDSEECVRRAQAIKEEFDNLSQAYISACLRAFLPSDIKKDSNPWTSCNAWRKLEIEIPSKNQFEQLMRATGKTADELGEWDCEVLAEAARRYKAGTLTEIEFGGC
jgi:hypothetical protein